MAGGIEGLKAGNAIVGQVVTVSAALLAFTVTFAEKFTPKDHPIVPPTALKLSWACFALTILACFWTMMATTGTLDQIDRGAAETNPRRWNIRIPAALSMLAFLAGVTCLIVTGWQVTAVG